MASYYARWLEGPRQATRVFDYDAAHKKLVSVDARAEFEEGEDYYAIKIDGRYLLVCDAGVLMVGDCQRAEVNQYPRLEFVEQGCGARRVVGVLTEDGRVSAPEARQSDALPSAGMNLKDTLVLTATGMASPEIAEVSFLVHNGDYVTTGGKLIRIPGV